MSDNIINDNDKDAIDSMSHFTHYATPVKTNLEDNDDEDKPIENENEKKQIEIDHDLTLAHFGFWKASYENIMPWEPKYITDVPLEDTAESNQEYLIHKLNKIEKCILEQSINGKIRDTGNFKKCYYCQFCVPLKIYEFDNYCWTSIYSHYIFEHNIKIDEVFAEFLNNYSNSIIESIPDDLYHQNATHLMSDKPTTSDNSYDVIRNAIDHATHKHPIEHNDPTKKYIGFFKRASEKNYPWDLAERSFPEKNTSKKDQSKLIIKLLQLQQKAIYHEKTNITKCVFCSQDELSEFELSKRHIEEGEFELKNFVWSECYVHYLSIHNVACDPEFEKFIFDEHQCKNMNKLMFEILT